MSSSNVPLPLADIETGAVRLRREGPAAYVQLHRPEKANAYNQPMLEALQEIFVRLDAASDVRVVVISGAGPRAFCAGADLEELDRRDARDGLRLKSAEVFTAISQARPVTLAAVNGAAVAGGLELALACDLRIAAQTARFWLPEPELGLIPAAGGTQRLARVVGHARAKEMILAGSVWNADEALRFGLASQVTAPEELLAAAQQWVERIARRDGLALELAKRAIDLDGPSAGYDFERVAEALLYHLRRKGENR